MSERLGAVLLRARRLRPDQLEDALRRQAERGGRLGTNLVETGAIGLDLLSAALASQRGVPAATVAELDSVPPAVLAQLPLEIAARCMAFPLRAGQGAFVVAMASPWDPSLVRTLSEAVQRSVVAKLVPELRLLDYLEKRYGLAHPRKARPASSSSQEAPSASSDQGPFRHLAAGEFLSSEEDDLYMKAGGSLTRTPAPFSCPAAPPPPSRAPAPAAHVAPTTVVAPPQAASAPAPIAYASPTAPSSPAPPSFVAPVGISLDPFGDAPVIKIAAPSPVEEAVLAPDMMAPVPELDALLVGEIIIDEATAQAVSTVVPPPVPVARQATPAAIAPADLSDPLASLSWAITVTPPTPEAAPPPPPTQAPAVAAAEQMPAGAPAECPPARDSALPAPAASVVAISAVAADPPEADLLSDPPPAPISEMTVASPAPSPEPELSVEEVAIGPPPEPHAVAAAAPARPAPLEEAPPVPELASGLSWSEAIAQAPTPPAPQAVGNVASAVPASPPDERALLLPPGDTEAPSDAALASPAPADVPTEAPAEQPWVFAPPTSYRPVASMLLVEDALVRATRPEKVLETLLWACEGRFDAAVFFLIDGQRARARDGFGPSGPVAFDDGFSIVLTEPSLVGAAAQGALAVLEQQRETPADAALAARMGAGAGSLTAAVPFQVDGRTLGVLWGGVGTAPVREALGDELERLATLGTRAFSRVPWGPGERS